MEAVRFCMYEPIILPSINWTTLTKRSVSELRVTAAPGPLIRLIKQVPPSDDPAEGILVDPTEWTIFDTISWTIVLLLFLLITVLVVYLTMASPCCNSKMRCECKTPISGSLDSTNKFNLSSDEKVWDTHRHQNYIGASINDDDDNIQCACSWNSCPQCGCSIESNSTCECHHDLSQECLPECPPRCTRKFRREYANESLKNCP